MHGKPYRRDLRLECHLHLPQQQALHPIIYILWNVQRLPATKLTSTHWIPANIVKLVKDKTDGMNLPLITIGNFVTLLSQGIVCGRKD